jgi:hypothetical protein
LVVVLVWVSYFNCHNRFKSRVSSFSFPVYLSQTFIVGTNHLLVTFGDDFKFKNAALQFRNMDLLINAINKNTGLGVHIRYSTLSEYFSAVHSESTLKKISFPFHRGDFFPYADNGDSYWTGYYSTRPTLKVREILFVIVIIIARFNLHSHSFSHSHSHSHSLSTAQTSAPEILYSTLALFNELGVSFYNSGTISIVLFFHFLFFGNKLF